MGMSILGRERVLALATVFTLTAFGVGPAQAAATLDPIVGFSSDAGCPTGALNNDSAGNLYVSLSCGTGNNGSIVQLAPPTLANPHWSIMPVWTFTDAAGGSSPTGGMVSDGAGGFYGTTLWGGLGSGQGNGTLFHLSPPQGSSEDWDLQTIRFFHGTDGNQPTGSILRKGKYLFGTTTGGGSHGAGTIYMLNLSTGKLKTVWNFTGNSDGGYPQGGLIDDGAGGFYGTTSSGGTSSQGVVYHLTPTVSGAKTFNLTPLYAFNGDSDGGFPEGTLVLWNGSLYGTCEGGGGSGFHGTVWELAPPSGGNPNWSYTVLRHLTFADGAQPTVGPTRLGKNLYFVSPYGGQGPGAAYGTIDTLKKSGNSWSFSRRIAFNQGNGAYPNSPLLPDGAGGFYGATTGGIFGYGSVFHLTP